MVSKNIGVQGRKDQRLHQKNKITKSALRILAKEFPNPSNIPSHETFTKKWTTITRSMNKSFGSIRDYRAAFNTIVHTIEGYRKEYQWNISAPSYLFTQKEKKQLRNEAWLKRAWAFQSSYQIWFENIGKTQRTDSVEQCYQALMLSFMCHSGHCNTHLVSTFSSNLLHSIDIKSVTGYPFIQLQIEANGFNTNVHDEDEPVTQYNCYLSPITQGLLHRWMKLNKTQWKPPEDKFQIYQAITASFDKHNAAFPSTLNQLTSVAISIAEKQPAVEMNQALVEYAIGNTKSYSLPSDNLARLEDQKVASCSITQLYGFKSNAKNTAIKNHCEGPIPPVDLHALLTQAFKPESSKQKISPKLVQSRLRKILKAELPLYQKILADWFLTMSLNAKVSSLVTYNSTITRRWLYATENADLFDMDGDDYESLYDSLLDSIESDSRKKAVADRLNQIHGFAVTNYTLPALLNRPGQGSKSKSHTRSGFIDEALFSALLLQVKQLSDLNDTEKNTLAALLIIAYRCGLRIGEIRKLRLCDIEHSSTGWIAVRSNIFGDNKTASALRKVPLFSMLLADELEIVNECISSKRATAKSDKNLLFTLGQDKHKPIDAFLLSNFTSHVLRDLSGLNFLVFHHLRHSCLSRLQLMMEIDNVQNILPNAVPYSTENIEKIRHQLCGNTKRNVYYAISAFAGHSSPETCFNNYFHFTDWIVGHKLAKAQLPLSKSTAIVFGLCSRRVYTQLKNENSTLYPYHFQLYLYQKLKPKLLKNNIQTTHKTPEIERQSQSRKYSLELCYAVLEHIQNGFDIREMAFKFRIEQETIDKWLKNAKQIQSLSTSTANKHKRRFSAVRSNKLLPGRLKSSAELKLISTFIIKLREHYKEKKMDLDWAVLYALNNSNTNKSGIYFSKPSELARFISTLHFAIPNAYWRVVTHTIEQSPIKHEWEAAYIGIRSVKGRKASKQGRIGSGAVRLELRHPNEKSIKKQGQYKKFSSHALMYLFHMMGIMMLNK